LGITLAILKLFRGVLNFEIDNHVTFWAACMVGFYGLFRKGNLCARRVDEFNPRRDLTRGDLTQVRGKLTIRVRHSKVIQFGERVLEVMLPYIPRNSSLCPTTAVANMIRRVPTKGPTDALFTWRTAQGTYVPLTHNTFVSTLKSCLKDVGVDPSKYSGHSFRRGGATWAHSIGVSDKLIKTQGDWASDAYMIYITIEDKAKELMVNKMASAATSDEIGGP
jgi:integrase